MSSYIARLMVFVVLLTGMMVWQAPPAFATVSGTSVINDCDKYVGLTNRIAGCIRESLGKATQAYFDPKTGFYSTVARAITALITIAVAIYGVMLAMGMIENVGRDTIMLILKIAIVGYFSTHADLMYKTVVDAMDYTAAEVVKFTPASGSATGQSNGGNPSDTNFSQITCIQNMKEAQAEANTNSGANKAVVGPWMGMDCILDTVIGIKDASTGGPKATNASKWVNDNLDPNNKGLSRGMLMVFFSGINTSVVGIILGIVGFVFIWGLVQLILKALFVYIAGYLGIALLMLLAPLFIPLALFQVTKSYFDKWIKLLIGFTLQPVIILVFISFSIAAVDLATFSGNYSIIYRMAGEASRQPNFNLNKYLEENGAVTQTTKQVVQVKATAGETDIASTAAKAKVDGATAGLITSNCTTAKMNANAALKRACENYHYAIRVAVHSIDWKKLAEARAKKGPAVVPSDAATPEQQICNEVLAAAIFCGIVIFVMNGLFKVVPALAQDLLGDYHQSPDLYNFNDGKGSTLPGMNKVSDMMSGLKDTMKNAVGVGTR